MNTNNNFSAENTAIAQVTNVQKNKFILTDDAGNEINGILKDSFTYRNEENPVVGDYVRYIPNPYGDSFIEEILPRKTRFHRTDRGGHGDSYVKNLKSETLAANFGYVFIISSLNQNFNSNRIARYVSITNESGAVPVVILTKADLCTEDEAQLNKEIIQAICGKVQVFALSSFTGQELMKTSEIREDGINETFSDITELFDFCKFRNCRHTQEPDCAVLAALNDGSLDPERWELYKSLQEENTWGKEKMIQIAKFQRDLHKYSPKHMR